MNILKENSLEDLPREKLIKNGASSLSNYELFAILLRTGSKKENVLSLSKRILVENSVEELSKKTFEELIQIRGISSSKATTILSSFELIKRLNNNELKKQLANSSQNVYNIIKDDFRNISEEKVMLILTNTKNKVIKKEFVSSGGLDYSIVDIRMILKKAILNNAKGIIIAHNHPSGDPMPSQNDKEVTRELKEVCTKMNIQLLDHIIIGNNNYYSFSDNSIL